MLTALAERGVATVSSEELAAAAGVNSAKLRKDLSYLGSYGTRGVGYDVEYLVYQISRELGLTQDWPVVIVGIGNLGAALANYGGFASRGFRVAALVDADPALVGKPVAGLAVQHTRRPREDRRGRTACRSASSRPRPAPPRRSATGWSPPASPPSSTSRRPCCPCPTASTCARSTSSIELQILAFHEQRKADGCGGPGAGVPDDGPDGDGPREPSSSSD